MNEITLARIRIDEDPGAGGDRRTGYLEHFLFDQ